jgi:hypothetical protein
VSAGDPIGDKGAGARGRLPLRDLIVMPLIVLATVFTLGFSGEVAARIAWPDQMRDSCEVWRGPLGFFKPDCQARVKLAEGPWVSYAYNDCGYRSAAPCTPRPPGALRVAVLGSSIGRGYAVSYADSFTGRLETRLTRTCGRPVQFQTIAVDEAKGPTWHTLADRTGEAEALHPDAMVVVIAPFDIMQYSAAPPPATPAADPLHVAAGSAPDAPPKGAMAWLRQRHLTESLALFGAQHFVYEDPDRFIPLYLRHGDQADFLRPPFSKAWQLRLRVADTTLSRIADQAHKANIPLIVVFMPARGQAILSASSHLPQGVDPFVLDKAIGDIARRNHAAFVDVTDITRKADKVAADYYPVDGHPNSRGHALIAQGLGRALTNGVAAFSGCAAARASL